MSSLTTSPTRPPFDAARPSIPAFDTIPPRSFAAEQLQALETRALPALARQRAFLIRTWCSDPQHGAPVFVTEHDIVWVHPAGVDRVATAVAEEQAAIREVAALRELLVAFRRYDLGGSAVADEIHDEAEVPQEAVPVHITAGDIIITAGASDAQAYEAWMRAHTAAVQMELWIARKDRDAERAHDLQVECRELERRLRQLTGRSRGRNRLASRTA